MASAIFFMIWMACLIVYINIKLIFRIKFIYSKFKDPEAFIKKISNTYLYLSIAGWLYVFVFVHIENPMVLYALGTICIYTVMCDIRTKSLKRAKERYKNLTIKFNKAILEAYDRFKNESISKQDAQMLIEKLGLNMDNNWHSLYANNVINYQDIDYNPIHIYSPLHWIIPCKNCLKINDPNVLDKFEMLELKIK